MSHPEFIQEEGKDVQWFHNIITLPHNNNGNVKKCTLNESP